MTKEVFQKVIDENFQKKIGGNIVDKINSMLPETNLPKKFSYSIF